jgi:hypothetical protein
VASSRDDLSANLKVKVPAGHYVIEVSGGAIPDIPSSRYGSLGQYFITGSVPTRGNQAVADLIK